VIVEQAFSAELLRKMEHLTLAQRLAIPRLVRAQADGRSMRELLRGPDRICAWSTYYRPGRGWHYQPAFVEALAQARREYDAAMLRVAVEEAAELMRRTTPLAARVLERLIVAGLRATGDDLPDEELTFEARQLRLLARQAEGPAAVRALGLLMRGSGADRDRGLRAAMALLDRADIETAVKSAGGEAAEWRELLRELTEDGQVADVDAETEDIPPAGLPAA